MSILKHSMNTREHVCRLTIRATIVSAWASYRFSATIPLVKAAMIAAIAPFIANAVMNSAKQTNAHEVIKSIGIAQQKYRETQVKSGDEFSTIA